MVRLAVSDVDTVLTVDSDVVGTMNWPRSMPGDLHDRTCLPSGVNRYTGALA